MEEKAIPIFDTHAHYDSSQFDEDRDSLLSAMFSDGYVRRIVNVGATFGGAKASLELAHRYSGIYAACGVHPDEVGELDEGKLARLKEMCADEKCVAVGEIGLDYHWMVQPKEAQQQWFVRQLKLSKEAGLPVNVHSRDAAQDTFDIIRDHHAGSTGGIIHCYSGSPEMAVEYVKLGYHIGIGGVVTFKNGRVLKEVVRAVPIERLVTETDAPYLAPVPYRGKRNCSAYIEYMVREIAALKEMDTKEAAKILYENALRVYRLETEQREQKNGSR